MARKYYKPVPHSHGEHEIRTSVQVRVDVKQGDETKRVPLDIPKEGYSTEDENIQKQLDNHGLKGKRFGFVEYEPKSRNKAPKKPEPSTNVVEDVETPNEAAKYLKENIKGVGQKSVNDLDKILKVAEEHDIEFPNLDVPKG